VKYLAIALLLSLLASESALAKRYDEIQPRMVIVIDDLGNNLDQGLAALALPGPVTYLVEKAHQQGKEIMLHAPMASIQHLKLGPGALTAELSEVEFKKKLNDSLNAVAFAVGMNNHMGSSLTQQSLPMQWVMDIVQQRGMFFLDSRTTAKSVAWDVAKQRGIPVLQRDVFLDHEQSQAFLQKQFIRAVRIARKHGSAIVIGHPYPVTTSFLQEAIPALDEAGIQLVSASALLMQQKIMQSQSDVIEKEHVSECDAMEGHECE
jgi:hypothetical protein